MRIIGGKAPELVKKAAATLRSKACALRARLLVLASLRRRLAMAGAISHRIGHALMAAAERPEKAGKGALVPREAIAGGGNPVVDLSRQLALFGQEDDDDHGGNHGYHDWTHSLFNDDGDYRYFGEDDDYGDDDHDHHGDVLLLDAMDDEPSVMDIIRRSREVEGLEFNVDDEIDQAAGMFIARFRERMNRSF